MKENVVKEKSYAFAIRIVNLYKLLSNERREYVLSKQCLRSGTAIGALIFEGEHGQSKADFLSKMNIALKEANETAYWLNLLKDTEYLSVSEFESISRDITDIIRLLASIVKTTKDTLSK